MSDIFEQDIEDENDLSQLEDHDSRKKNDSNDEQFVYPDKLYLTKLEYSSEGVYCTVPERFPDLKKGDAVIIPTRYSNRTFKTCCRIKVQRCSYGRTQSYRSRFQ